MTAPVDKFQMLLRELFQFDCADLDFGIYRIMNHKRGAIEKFISTDLPKAVAEELDRGALADQSRTAAELKEVAAQIKETLGPDALDADGRLAGTYHGTPLGKRYLALQAQAAGGRGRETLEAAIFNHLHAFFSRYYQDGDFISKRRYSRRERYAIPYNGEEVYLYWANHDQYYVKTAEHFHDYTFTSGGVTVHFKLQAANVEQNNVKGDKRFFLPRLKQIDWDENAAQVVIPFEYRPLNAQEDIAYGKKSQQDAIIAQAVVEIPKRFSPRSAGRALAALTSVRRTGADGRPVTLLEHHLRQYTRRNTSDFFIHKNLKGFLSRELDFYLKNEVLNLDEMDAAGEDRAEGWFQMMRVIKAIGARIIEFLHQIEEFQKMLWEKRKFITETQYCITVGNIDESFYADIASCDAQWAEWKQLFHIDEEQADLFTSGKSKKERRVAFLKEHPTLVIDTKHFEQKLVDRLLGSIDDLDGKMDGLLIHSENFQSLNLLKATYRRNIQSICVDPPYNIGEDGFLYKDQYQHSSWIAMMTSRFEQCCSLLADSGVAFVHIDDNEYKHLWFTLAQVFGKENYLGSMVWKRRSSSALSSQPLSLDHEYVLVFGRDSALATLNGLVKTEDAYPHIDEKTGKRYASTDLTVGMTREQRPNQFFSIANPRTGREFLPNPNRVWRFFPETMAEVIARDLIIWPDETEGDLERPRYKTYFDPENMSAKPCSSWIENSNVNDREIEEQESDFALAVLQSGMNSEGGKVVDRIFGKKAFSYPKPVSLVRSLIRASTKTSDCVLDFFAGSGTTGHAVISLNQEDSNKRKFILAEMGEYFDTILLPRIKKVTFTPEWQDGKPVRMATHADYERGPRIIKYIRLESHEDAENNIEFDDVSRQRALDFEDYLIKYMLKWETRASETLLNVEKLARPFSYKLRIHAGGQTREKVADIPETFNYLLGLHVRTRKVYDDNGRRYLVYRGRIDHREVVVIWRETEGWKKADLARDKKFVAERMLTEGADEVFVNGDSFIPNAKSLEPVFKARMFAPVEA